MGMWKKLAETGLPVLGMHWSLPVVTVERLCSYQVRWGERVVLSLHLCVCVYVHIVCIRRKCVIVIECVGAGEPYGTVGLSNMCVVSLWVECTSRQTALSLDTSRYIYGWMCFRECVPVFIYTNAYCTPFLSAINHNCPTNKLFLRGNVFWAAFKLSKRLTKALSIIVSIT